MFGIIEDLTKSAISIAVTPVTVAVDTVMIPVDATVDGDVFQRTNKTINNAARNFNNAVKPKAE